MLQSSRIRSSLPDAALNVARLLLPLMLVACASTPDIQIPLRSAEECRLELAAAFPPGVDPDSVRDAQLDSALVRYREGRVEPEDTTRQLQRPPQLLDPRAVQRLMSVYYPPNLLSNGIGGRTDLMFYVGPDGVPEKFRIAETSGYREMDVASVQAIGNSRFSPGIVDGCPAWGIVKMPVAWRAEMATVRAYDIGS